MSAYGTSIAPDALRKKIAGVSPLPPSFRPLPDRGENAGDLLASVSRLLFDQSLHNGHPRFMGYVTSSAAPIGMLGDMLAAAVNPNVGAWTLSPVASEIEAQTVRWIAELIRYPGESGGLLVSGGNMANMAAFWAARVAVAGAAVRTKGMDRAQRLVVYASSETHTWVQKATDLAGLGTDAIRWIPTGRDLRLARLLHETAAAHPELQTSESGLSISTFRYVPPELRARVGEPAVATYLNALNEGVQARLEKEGEVFLSNAVHHGMYVLRGCIVNFRTDEVDVRAIPEIVVRVGRAVHAERSGEHPGA